MHADGSLILYLQFWNELLNQVTPLGFRIEVTESNANAASLSEAAQKTAGTIDWESNEGKFHVKALSEYLELSTSRAKSLRQSVLQNLSSSDNDLAPIISSPLRTKRLFLLVLDAHHQYQCLRLELLAECLRFEAEETDM